MVYLICIYTIPLVNFRRGAALDYRYFVLLYPAYLLILNREALGV